jgi:hypothetical protein
MSGFDPNEKYNPD